MATRKMGNSWWVDFRFSSVRYRKRSPDNSKAGAQAYEAVLRRKLAQGESIKAVQETAISLESFAEEWMRIYVRTHNKSSEIYNKQRILCSQFLPRWGKWQLKDITFEEIERFKADKISLGIKPKSINNYLAVLGKLLRSAVDWQRLDKIPKLKMLKCVSQRLDFLSSTECYQLLQEKTDPFWHGMTLVALRTGMRPGEIAALEWSDVDLLFNIIRVSRSVWRNTITSTKTYRTRHIPITKDLLTWFQGQTTRKGLVFPRSADGTHLGDCMRNKGLTALCERAGVRRITWYTLRHTFATRLAAASVPLPAIKELLGHANISMTMRYAHVSSSSLRSAVEVLQRGENMPEINNYGQPVGNVITVGEQGY